MSSILQVVTTTEDKQQAQSLAQELVEQRLAACVQISGPIESTYRWEGAVHASAEWLCTIKTNRAKLSDLQATILQRHSYDVPEIVVTEIVDGSPAYLDWLAAELKD